MKKIFLLLILLLITQSKDIGIHFRHPEATLNFTSYMDYYNYPHETHDITTEDGYILTYFRIQQKGGTIESDKQVVYFQHGLLDSSDLIITNSEELSLAYTLANKGYDVWLGNNRGNKHSKEHTNLDVHSEEFWDFSFQEFAEYDLPAAFEYIGELTGRKINYIGHSQGTIQMFAALSENNPVIEKYLNKYFALGPVAWIRHTNSPFLGVLNSMADGLLKAYDIIGRNQFGAAN